MFENARNDLRHLDITYQFERKLLILSVYLNITDSVNLSTWHSWVFSGFCQSVLEILYISPIKDT